MFSAINVYSSVSAHSINMFPPLAKNPVSIPGGGNFRKGGEVPPLLPPCMNPCVFSSVRIQAIQHYGYIPEFFAALHLSSIAAKNFFNAVPDLLLLPDCSDEGIREESSNESCDISVLWG